MNAKYLDIKKAIRTSVFTYSNTIVSLRHTKNFILLSNNLVLDSVVYHTIVSHTKTIAFLADAMASLVKAIASPVKTIASLTDAMTSFN